jgi:hypothetical protein
MRTQQLQVEPTRTKPRESHADNVDMVVDMVHALVALASMQLPARHAFGIPLPELEQQANSFHHHWESCVPRSGGLRAE